MKEMKPEDITVGIDLSLWQTAYVFVKDQEFKDFLISVNSNKDLISDNCYLIDKNYYKDKPFYLIEVIKRHVNVLDDLISSGFRNFSIEGQSFLSNNKNLWVDIYPIFRYVLATNNCNYVFTSPLSVKKFLLGKCEKGKGNISLACYKKYDLDFSIFGEYSNNIYDALGVAMLGDLFFKKMYNRRLPDLLKYENECLESMFKKGNKTIFYVSKSS